MAEERVESTDSTDPTLVSESAEGVDAEKVPMGDYHKFSKFMGSWPTMSIFRRFGTLNAQNILFLQSELVYLEGKNLHSILEDHRGLWSTPLSCVGGFAAALAIYLFYFFSITRYCSLLLTPAIRRPASRNSSRGARSSRRLREGFRRSFTIVLHSQSKR